MVGKRMALPPAFSMAAASPPASSRGRVTTMPLPFNGSQDLRRAGGTKLGHDGGAERLGIFARRFGAHYAPAILRSDERAQTDLSLGVFRVGAERQRTVAAQAEADGALGAHARRGPGGGERRHERAHIGAIAQAL